MCEKKTYPSRRSAKQAARRWQNVSGNKLYVYLCDECGHWHMTTADADKRGGIRDRKARAV